MADYVASALLPFQSRINKKYNANELRELQNPILRQALGYSDLLMGKSNVDGIKESDKRSVYTFYLKKMTADNGTARTFAPVGVQSDSGQVTLSWVTFSEKLMLYAQVGYDNVFDDVSMLDHQIMEKQRILRERIGNYIVAQLHAGRTLTSPSIADGSNRLMNFNAVTNAFENVGDQKSYFFQNAASIMRQNKYYDKFDVIADPYLYKQAEFLRNQGQGNYQNLSYQFESYKNIMFHSVLGDQVANAYSGTGCAIVLPEASFSTVPWIPKINRTGWGDSESYNGSFMSVPDGSGMPLTYAARAWSQKADGSGNGSTVQTIQLNMELSVDIAFNVAPISVANETAIYEFGQL